MRVAGFAAAAIVLSVASVAAQPATKVAPSVFSAKDTAITVHAGQTFLIALESNPSTGYSWSASAGFTASIIALDGSSYAPPARVIPGAGGTQIFVVRALASGTTKLDFGYSRPWEKGKPPIRTAEFAVTVRV